MKLIAEELTKDNHPDFGNTVILLEKKDTKLVSATLGSLKAITKEGFEWTYCGENSFSIESMFGIKPKPNTFNPTHFAKFEIEFK